MYVHWINALLGLVIIGLTFFNLTESTLTWTLAVLGAIIAIDSFWAIFFSEDEEERYSLHRRT